MAVHPSDEERQWAAQKRDSSLTDVMSWLPNETLPATRET